MNTKLQELTDKIYQEGVEKGKETASAIIAKAQSEAEALINKAKTDAATIVQEAENKSKEIIKNTQSELKLFAQQSVNALKSEVTNMVCGTIATASVKAATTDKAFMQKVILELVQEWSKNQSVTIETKEAKELTDYFASNAKELLSNGVKITQANGVKADFSIEPEKDGFKVSFGEDEFIAYFKEFLRPKLVEMLF